MLQENRGQGSKCEKLKRGKKVGTAGKAIQVDEVAMEVEVDESVAGTSGTSTSNRGKALASKKKRSENICVDCQADYSKYKGPDWLQCVSCQGWVCGVCNNQASRLGFQCERCGNGSDVESD